MQMKKMAEGVLVPSLVLLFEMVADEASDFLDRHYAHRTGKKLPLIRLQGDESTVMTDKMTCEVEFHQGKI